MPPAHIRNFPTELNDFVKMIHEHQLQNKGDILVTLNTGGLGGYYENTDGCTGVLKEWNGLDDEALVSLSDGESSGGVAMINMRRFCLGRQEYHVHPLYLEPPTFCEGLTVIDRNGQAGIVVEYAARNIRDPSKYGIRVGENELPGEPQAGEYFAGKWFAVRDDDDSDYE